MSRYLLCLTTKSYLFANTSVKALIAHWNAPQLDADVVEPNTIAVTRLFRLLAMKPKAPVKSAWVLPKTETDLDVCHAGEHYGHRMLRDSMG
jgi:hypothetical protein